MAGGKQQTAARCANPEPERMRRRSFAVRLGWISLAALVLRLIASLEMAAANGGRNSVFVPSSQTDLATYLRLSLEILEGRYEGVFYYQPYYYAVFLPVLRWICNCFSADVPYGILLVQAICGAGAVFCCGYCAALLWSRRAGLWTAAMGAVSLPLLLCTPFAQNETLQTFHFAMLALLSILTLRRRNLYWYMLTGVMLGIAILTRGNAVLFLPFLLLVLGWKGLMCKDLRRTLIGIVLCIAMCYLVQLPFILHNTRLTGKWTGPSTAADAVLALGNTPEAPAGGRFPGLPAGPMEYPETYSDFMARAEERPVIWQMWDFFCREPGAFLELQFRKVLLFWDGREIPNNVSLYSEGQNSQLMRMLLIGDSRLLLSLSLAGWLLVSWKCWRGRRYGLILLWGMVLIYWGGTALFYILSRFRVPMLPVIFVFGGIWIDQCCRAWHRGGRKALCRREIPALLAAVVVCVIGYDWYRAHCEAPLQRLFRPDGIVYAKKDGSVLHLDHGPFTFGEWDAAMVSAGTPTVVRKVFAGTQNRGGEVEFQIMSQVPVSGTVNGVPFAAMPQDTGMQSIKVTLPSGGETLEMILSAPGEVHLLFDRQRNYGRSFLNGIPVDGEWICRFREKKP